MKLTDFDPHVRARILAQLDADAAEARRNRSARSQGIRPTESQPNERPALDKVPCGKAAGKGSDGERYRVTFTVYAVRPKDWDNNFCKVIQDQLIYSGWLPDDNWRILEGAIRTRKSKPGEERTEVEIERLS